jgi:DNA-binding MarR family transcriptional regulator
MSGASSYREGMTTDNDASRPATLWNNAWRGVLFATSRTLQTAEPELIAQAGFPLTWLDVLAQLYDAGEDGLRMQELEQRSLFTRSGLTRLIDRIESAGLVRREAVPGDRRGVQVILTAEGRARHDAAFAEHNKVIEREFGQRLTDKQLRAVADALATFWHDNEGLNEG